MSLWNKLLGYPESVEGFDLGNYDPNKVSRKEIKKTLESIGGVEVSFHSANSVRAMVVKPGARDIDDVLDTILAESKKIGVNFLDYR